MKLLSALFVAIIGLTTSVQATFFINNISHVVAGQDQAVRVSDLLPAEQLEAVLHRPTDLGKMSWSIVADDSGVARHLIDGWHLRIAGDYHLQFVRDLSPSTPQVQDFTVVASEPSSFRSKFTLKDTAIPADGETEAHFWLQVKDAFGNAIPNRTTKVISSRNTDLIQAETLTDSQGVIRGRLISQTPGISVLSAIVSGTTVVHDKPEIVWHLPVTDDLIGVGAGVSNIGSFLKAQLFDPEPGVASYFAIVDTAPTAIVDEWQSITIVAKDENGADVPNYLGKVRFSSSDNRAQLPADYQFVESDQGKHTFSLAVIFGTVGSQTISVHDLDDFRISAEHTTQVSASEEEPVLEQADPGIVIISPQPGSYKSARMTITGQATQVKAVNLFDGTYALVKNLEVDPSGNFVYQTPALANGLHKFVAYDADDEEIVSAPVSVVIDRIPPTALNFATDPSGVMEPDFPFQLKVSSSDELSRANCVFNQIATELEPAGQKFVAFLRTPLECGTYPIGCTVADLLGNEREEPEATVIQVCADEVVTTPEPADEPITVEPEPEPNIAPTSPINLVAEPGDRLITLYWSPANDDKGIDRYRLEYGLDPTTLDSIAETPDDRTRWYVDGLEVATTYYFRVIAIDTDETMSVPSEVVPGTTLGEDFKSSAPAALEKSGSRFFWPMVALFATILVIIFHKKRT